MRSGLPLGVALAGVLILGWSNEASAQQRPPTLRGAERDDRLKKELEKRKAAQEAAAQKAKPAEEAEAKAEKKAEKAEDKAEAKAEKAEDKAEAKAEKAEAKAEKKAEKAEDDAEEADDDAEELLEKKRKTRDKRRKARKRGLAKRWGEAVTLPEVKAELRRHARRVARLERIKELAEAKENDKLAERVDKLMTMETGRHEQRMAKLAKSGEGAAVQPAGLGKPEGAGKPVGAGKPEGAGKPAGAGK